MRSARRLGQALLLALLLAAAPAKGDPIVADLSSHIVAISSSFSGTSVVLFGATDGPGDIIAMVRGPEQKMTVWRKGKAAGIWVNAESVTFTNVPSFYTLVASRPIDEVLRPGAAALHRLGLAHLKLESDPPVSAAQAGRFSQALIAVQQRDGLFVNEIGKIAFLGDRLFRAAIDFPANIPTGTYLVEVFLVRDRDIVSAQTTPLIVSKIGLDAAVSDFSAREAAAYGAIAVVMALVTGWLASLPFRGA